MVFTTSSDPLKCTSELSQASTQKRPPVQYLPSVPPGFAFGLKPLVSIAGHSTKPLHEIYHHVTVRMLLITLHNGLFIWTPKSYFILALALDICASPEQLVHLLLSYGHCELAFQIC